MKCASPLNLIHDPVEGCVTGSVEALNPYAVFLLLVAPVNADRNAKTAMVNKYISRSEPQQQGTKRNREHEIKLLRILLTGLR